MAPDNFNRLDAKQTQAVLRDVNARHDGSGFAPETATVLAQALPFFPGWRLLDVANHTVLPAARCHVLYKPGEAIFLDGTNAPIYRLAREAPIALDTDKATSYVRFFFAQVNGQQGRFLLAETVDDLPWLGEPNVALRKEVGRRIVPLIAERVANGYQLAGTLLVGAGLFAAQIDVGNDGLIRISDQELLIEDLPMRDAVVDV